MKNILLFVLTAIASQSIFADVTCPSPESLKSIKFIQGNKIPWIAGPGNSSLWMLKSDKFNYEGASWNLIYSVPTSASSQEQAIQDGTNQFNKKQLIQPVKTFEGGNTVCTYTSEGEISTISAFSPPLTSSSEQSKKQTSSQFQPMVQPSTNQIQPMVQPSTNQFQQVGQPYTNQLQPIGRPNLYQGKPSTKHIQGNWMHNQAKTSIQPTSYIFCNEDNNCASGNFYDNTISVPEWHVIGNLSDDGSTIEWSNGTRWQRKQ